MSPAPAARSIPRSSSASTSRRFKATRPPSADIWPVRKPAKPGTHGRKIVIAGAAVFGTAIALVAKNILPLIIFAIIGIIIYSHAAKAAGQGGGAGCGAAGSGGHGAAAG